MYNVLSRLKPKVNESIRYLIVKRSAHNELPALNTEYLCNPKNITAISENITRRKGVGNIETVHKLHEQLQNNEDEQVKQQFYNELLKIPNDTHPAVMDYGMEPKILKYVGEKRKFSFKPKEFHDITKKLNIMRTNQLGNVAGNRSYYFLGALAELEQALIKYTVNKLLQLGYQLLSVPDILPSNIIESCGMNTKGERTQVYTLDHEPDLCLSGTSEMAIAGYLKNKVLSIDKLPVKLAAVSRCYRAETSSVAEERGIYRVHQFTKVEMFAVTTPEESDEVLESFRDFQERHFSSLDIHLQTLDMPPHELGAPAYRKYDLEAWLAGRKMYGEVSSCSNCTDYQSRRLNIKYAMDNGELRHVHTVNGTACAIPRLLIALLETHQNEDGTVQIPDALKPFVRFEEINREKRIPELKLKKIKR
ncbi:Seryl-tRNA synthetase mitochondrial [Carabus blaptoides fortunei]